MAFPKANQIPSVDLNLQPRDGSQVVICQVSFCLKVLLGTSFGESRTSRDHFFFSVSGLSWIVAQCNEYLFIEVKWQWAMLVLRWATASVHYSCL